MRALEMTRARLTAADIRRALKAATDAGLTVTSYTVDTDGIRVFTAPSVTAQAPPANDDIDELQTLAERIRNAARRS